MDKLREIERKRKEAYSWFIAHKSRGYKAVSDMDEPIMSDAALSRKHKELIAVGISVTIDCESCMQWHTEHGATLEEVLEAIDVAIMMGNGAVTVRARFAMDVMKDVFGATA